MTSLQVMSQTGTNLNATPKTKEERCFRFLHPSACGMLGTPAFQVESWIIIGSFPLDLDDVFDSAITGESRQKL